MLPCYLIILCNSVPNSLSFSHWGCVLKKTKWSVLVLTYCRLPGIENAIVLALRKIPLNSGLCAHEVGKQTSLQEWHLTPTSLLFGQQRKNSFSSLQTALLPVLAEVVGRKVRHTRGRPTPIMALLSSKSAQRPATGTDSHQPVFWQGINSSGE